MNRGLHMSVAGLLFVAALAAQAAESSATNSLGATGLPDTGVSLLRVTGALALVVGLFFAGVWFYKNWQRLLWRTKGAPNLNVIEVRSLGGRHALYLVGYHQQRLLLAASPGGVQFITHLPDADAVPPSAPSPSFARTLDDVVHSSAEKIPERAN